MPASNIAPIEVPFRGRILKVAGDRTFDTWTVTIINDTDMALRGAFERWMNLINKVTNNAGRVNPADYQTIAKVHQLGRFTRLSKTRIGANIPILRTYEFQGVFPTNVSQVDLSTTTDTIEEFTVELQFSIGPPPKMEGRILINRLLQYDLYIIQCARLLDFR